MLNPIFLDRKMEVQSKSETGPESHERRLAHRAGSDMTHVTVYIMAS